MGGSDEEGAYRRFHCGVAQLALVDGFYSQLGGFGQHQLVGRGIVVGDVAVENGVLDGVLDVTYRA